MRYLLYGYYGYGNFGDDLLLEALLVRIRAADPQARFLVRSRGVTPHLQAPDVRFLCSEAVLEAPGNRFLKAWRYLRLMARHLREVDVVVVGGGTLFLDKGRLNASLLLLWRMLATARRMGRRIVITGVAVDTLTHPGSLWLTRRIFALADSVAVRDALSLPYVAHCRTAVQSADLVLTLPARPLPPSRPQGARPCIGLCFIDYFGVNEPDDARRAQYLSQIAAWIRRERQDYDFCWILFQQDIGLRENWLLPALREQGLDYPAVAIESGQQLAEVLAGLQGVVSTRFHLGLLCAMQGVPVAIVEHELKMTALAQDFGLPSLSLDRLLSEAPPALAGLLSRHDPARVGASVGRQQALAERNFDWLAA